MLGHLLIGLGVGLTVFAASLLQLNGLWVALLAYIGCGAFVTVSSAFWYSYQNDIFDNAL